MKTKIFQRKGTWLAALATSVLFWSSCSPSLNRNLGGNSFNVTAVALTLNPTLATVSIGKTVQFAAVGGEPPYQFLVTEGPGSIDSDGRYIPPADLAGGNTAKVTIRDSKGIEAVADVTVVVPLQINTNSVNIAAGTDYQFLANGGLPPYAFSIQSGLGTMVQNGLGGLFTASSTNGTVVIRVRDSLQNEDLCIANVFPSFGGITIDLATTVNGTLLVTPSGGVGPYTFSMISGLGTIDPPTGSVSVFQAPASPGITLVRSMDSLGQTQDYQISIATALDLTPALTYVAASGTANLATSGGVPFDTPSPPYQYSILSGSSLGSLSAAGVFTAGTTAGTVVVKVQDKSGAIDTATLQVYSPLQIVPSTTSVGVNSTAPFGATGGVGPFTYSVISGVGSMAANVFSAGSSAGTATIRITDTTTGLTAETTSVTVYSMLLVSEPARTVAPTNTFTITPTGGVGPYSYTVIPNPPATGSVSPASGSSTTFTAGANAGTIQVQVQDQAGQVQLVTVTIVGALAITPTTKTLAVNNFSAFSATGGVPPYTYEVVTGGGGTFSGSFYTAPAVPGTYTVRVKDSHTPANTSNATVTVNAALDLTPASSSLAYSQTADLTAAGGVPPYTFTEVGVLPAGSTLTTLSATQARFTAGTTAGGAQLRVLDSLGNTKDVIALVNTAPPLVVLPTSVDLVVDNAQVIAPIGGVPPYTFNIVSGTSGGLTGSGATRTFIATEPANTTTVVRVGDSGASTPVDISFNVKSEMTVTPSNAILGVNNTLALSTAGGVSPIVYVLNPLGAGSVIGNLFTAPGTPQTVQIRAQDARGNLSGPTSVVVSSALQISPSSATLAGPETREFSVTGGVPPYTFTITPITGVGGSISPLGLVGAGVTDTTLTGSANGGTLKISVTDSLSNSASTGVITVTPGAPGSAPTISGVDNITLTSMRLNWTPVPEATGYKIRLDSGAWVDVGIVANWVFTGLTAGNNYTLSVVAHNMGTAGPAASTTSKICGTDEYFNGSACASCPLGQYSAGGAPLSCTSCLDSIPNSVSFTYSGTGGGTNNCQLATLVCNSGFTPNTSSKSCTSCAAGRYSAGSAACALCAAGTYSGAGAGSCSTCTNTTSGRYWTGTGNTTATCTNTACTGLPASATFSSHGGTSSTGCAWDCAAGFTKTGATCTACADGLYKDASGNGACSTCTAPVGKYWSAAGTGRVTDCSNTDCSNTTAGFYFTTHGGSNAAGCTNTACTNKPSGSTYTGHGGIADSCAWECNAGYQYNAGSCTACAAGYIKSASGNVACSACPAGKAASGTGNTSCTTCGTGTYTAFAGLPACLSCTNKPANAASVTYAASSGLTVDQCPYVTVTCDSGFTWNGNTTYAGAACTAAAPGSPTGLVLSNYTTTGARLSWTAVGGATSYDVRVGPSVGTGTYFSTTNTYYDFAGLTAGTTYHFAARGVNGGTPSDDSSISGATLTLAPSGLSTSAITSSSVTLSWGAVSGATGYEVSKNGADWTDVGTTSYAFTSLSPVTGYTLQVRAKNGSGSSAASNIAATTLDCSPGTYRSGAACLTCPAGSFCTGGSNQTTCLSVLSVTNGVVTAGTSAAGSDASADCSISALNCNGGYRVNGTACSACATGTYKAGTNAATSCSACAGGTYQNTTAQTSCAICTNRPANSLSATYVTTDSGLTSNVCNFLGVECASGFTWNSDTTAAGAACNGSAPAAPTGLSIGSVTSSSIFMSWSASPGATDYEVSTNGVSWTSTAGSTFNTYGSLSSGTTYTLYVRALNVNGTSGNSTSSSLTLPAVPTGLGSSGITGTSITLSWTGVGGTVTGYKVSTDGSNWSPTGSTSYTFTSLTPNNSYTLYVLAYNASGNGSSNTLAASTSNCAAGQYINTGTCATCPANSYCPGDNTAKTCSSAFSNPTNGVINSATSSEGASSSSQCNVSIDCNGGYYVDGTSCTACAAGYFKSGVSAATSCTECANGTYSSAAAISCTTCTTPVSVFNGTRGSAVPRDSALKCYVQCNAGYVWYGTSVSGSCATDACNMGGKTSSGCGERQIRECIPGYTRSAHGTTAYGVWDEICQCDPIYISSCGSEGIDWGQCKCNCGCFVKGTKVTLADGTRKAIETVQAGERVVGKDGKINKVKRTITIPHNGKKYSFNGGPYFVTASHPFWTKQGWKSIDPKLTALEVPNLPVTTLKVGDLLKTEKGWIKLEKIDSVHTNDPVYNLDTDGNSTYNADEYIVHNKEACP